MSDTHEGAEVQGQQGDESADVSSQQGDESADVPSQQGDESADVPSAEHDPRPVFEGDWASATPQQKGAHGQAVKAWKARHPELFVEATGSDAAASADTRVAAILGSGAAKAPLDPVGLRVLREVALDTSAPASARATAANALRAHEEEESRVATDVERDRVTAALGTLPEHDRLLFLERIVRRHEPAGWQSVFAQGQEGADPAAPAGAPS